MSVAERWSRAVATAPTRGAVIGGRYVLDRLVGSGGRGSVWLGRHVVLDRPVAVKLLGPEGCLSLGRTRFAREARACAMVRSPHVVEVIDCGVDDDAPHIVMEALEGHDLAAREAMRPWALGEVADVVDQVARGLSAAHAVGVVHRDIKLSNLFLARSPAGSTVKILDFGIAHSCADDGPFLTGSDVTLGTPSYMTPEQLLGLPIDHRVDVWALAVVAFRLATGAPCFRGRLAHEVTDHIVQGRRARVGDLVEGLPDELESLFDHAFARKLEHRFPSASAFASAFSRIAAGHAAACGRRREKGPLDLDDGGMPSGAEGAANAPHRLEATRRTWTRSAVPPSPTPAEAPRRQSGTYLRAAR